MDESELRSWIRLTKTGASARRLNRLLDHFGSPDALFGAPALEIARAEGCATKVAERLLDPVYEAKDRELDMMARLGVHLLTRHDSEYPSLLAEIADPPVALYVRGQILPEDERGVALVGSRRATDYGKRVAERLARELAEAGVTVVSGLALGVDTSAHWGAIRADGRTLACLGCGVDVGYPPQNRELAEKIAQHGALISEYPMTAPPDAWHFPSRNRVISGLSRGVVVVEAPARSGALITAECAVDQNREVFAVPGSVENYRSRGPHALIRDGAKLVESVEDILVELQYSAAGAQQRLPLDLPAPEPPQLTPEENALYALLGADPKPVDDVIIESSLPAASVNATLLMMEVKGVVRRLPGNAYVRAA